MRILSQDGMTDIPYEQCGFIVFFDELFSGNWDINANIGGNKSYKMAEYSTEEKARKAMEMLREAYSPVLVIKEQQEGIKPNIKPNDFVVGSISPMPKVEVLDNFYFRFPSDDEVEV